MMLRSMPNRIPSNPSALMLTYFIATSKACRCVGVDLRSADAFSTHRANRSSGQVDWRLDAGGKRDSRQGAKAAKQDNAGRLDRMNNMNKMIEPRKARALHSSHPVHPVYPVESLVFGRLKMKQEDRTG
jgi:hypothetical protein